MARLYPNKAKKAMLLLSAAMVAFFVVEPVLAALPNDPNYFDQEPFWTHIHAQNAWDYTTGSKRVVVAVIDTGLDTWHDDIRDNLWVNLLEIPDNGEDDDHNGYIDDIYGWNFAENNNDVRPSVFDSADDKEAVRHGTIVSGLIGAKGNNKLNGTGLNWKVSLMTLRAIKSNGSGSTGAVANAVDYAVTNGADVISMSFMGDVPDTAIYDALQRAYQKGVVVVAAAGNYEEGEGNLNTKRIYPGCFLTQSGNKEDWMLTVGSVDDKDKLSDFSEHGNCVNIMAPGEYIYSAERYSPQYGYPNQFGGPWFGTSFATPLVAGTAALIKSIHPEWGAKEIIPLILRTSDGIDAFNIGNEGQLGRGRINVEKAVVTAIATPISRPKGSFFYMQGFSLNRFDLEKNTNSKIANLDGSPIAVGTETIYGTDYATVLKKDGSSYWLEVDTSDGEMIANWNIPAGIIGDRNVLRFTSGELFVVSSKYSKKTKRTTFKRFSVYSRKTESKDVVGDFATWAIGSDGNVYASVLNKGSLTFNVVKFNSAPSLSFRLSNISKVYAVDVSEGKVAVLAVQKSQVKLFVSDQNGLSTVSLGSSVGKRWLLKTMYHADMLMYLPYAKEGGTFTVFGTDLRPIMKQIVPKLP